jgi:hypothetical protein
MWTDSETMKLNVYYVDSDSSQWVEVSGSATSSGSSSGSAIGTLIDEEPVVFTSNELKTFTHTDDTAEMRSVYIEKQIAGASVATAISKEVITTVETPVESFGNTQHSTAQSKIGSSSILFDTSAGNLHIGSGMEDWAFPGDFTVELWFYATAVGGMLMGGGVVLQIYFPATSALSLYLTSASGSTTYDIVNDGTFFSNNIPLNEWHHVALVRNNGVIKSYFNGVNFKTVSNALTIGTPPSMAIGSYNSGSTTSTSAYPFSGYIDEVRVSNIARYTDDFTPSTTAFIAEENTNVVLIHSNDANGSTGFTSSSLELSSLTTAGETILTDVIDLTAVYSLTQTGISGSNVTTSFSYDNGTSWTPFSADHGVLTVPTNSTQGKIKVDITAGGSFSSIDFTKDSAPYWELDTFEDWGIEFESGTTTKVTNRTGGDATARIRITAPTAAASSSASTINLTAGVIWDNHDSTRAEHDVALSVAADATLSLTHDADTEELRSVYIEKFIAGSSAVPATETPDTISVSEMSTKTLASATYISGVTYVGRGNNGADGFNVSNQGTGDTIYFNDEHSDGGWNITCTLSERCVLYRISQWWSYPQLTGGLTFIKDGVNIGTFELIDTTPSLWSIGSPILEPGNYVIYHIYDTSDVVPPGESYAGTIMSVDDQGWAFLPYQPAVLGGDDRWQLESFDDWGVQFTDSTTTTLINNTGADATIRARLTKPTAIATTSSSGGGATTLAELTDSTTATTDPLITSNLAVGHFWINSTSGEAYVCTDATTDDNIWTNIGSGVGGVGLTAMTGGTTSTYSVGGVSYKSHVFTGSGSFTVTSEGDADVLLVAGGGAGSSGTNGGAGGGAGGVIVQQLTLSATSYSFTIGAGGTAIHSVAQSDIGGNGEDSTFSTLTSIGGGAGGKWGSTVSLRNGQDGGSGGGGAEMHGGSGSTSGGAGYSGQGYDGGGSSAAFGGSGGGGAGAVGGSPTTNNGADGGIGLANDYSTGVDQYYSGGGGGHGDVPGTNTDGSGGLGGGGDIASGVGGGVNTGGGGAGGGYYAGHSPGNGGSGVLVVRYAI